MKIVAFLQNQWFKEPERIKWTIERTIEREKERGARGKTADEVREYYLAAFLFWGCLTGQRLKKALGELTNQIVWEEVSREIGGSSSSCFPPDLAHVRDVLDRHKPEVVLTFGKLALEGLGAVRKPRDRFRIISSPHPASRSPDVPIRLKEVARELYKLLGGRYKCPECGGRTDGNSVHKSPGEVDCYMVLSRRGGWRQLGDYDG